MNIIVCLKQVPGTTEVKIDPNTNTLIRQGIKAIVNPFDSYALEEGVRLKEKLRRQSHRYQYGTAAGRRYAARCHRCRRR